MFKCSFAWHPSRYLGSVVLRVLCSASLRLRCSSRCALSAYSPALLVCAVPSEKGLRNLVTVLPCRDDYLKERRETARCWHETRRRATQLGKKTSHALPIMKHTSRGKNRGVCGPPYLSKILRNSQKQDLATAMRYTICK